MFHVCVGRRLDANPYQIQGDVLVLYVYQLKKDTNGVETVTVEKVSFRKNGVPS